MNKVIDQHTDIDKRIHDFVDRKSAPWYTFGQTIIDRLSLPLMRSGKNKDVEYETLQWRRLPSR